MAAAASRGLLVDVHTHVYLPRYVSFLRSRTSVPRIFTRSAPDGSTEERLLILDAEPSGGRPMGPQVFPRSTTRRVIWMNLNWTSCSTMNGN